jgi:hypothetical protein
MDYPGHQSCGVQPPPLRVCVKTPDLLCSLTRAALQTARSTRHSVPSRDRQGVGSEFSHRLLLAGLANRFWQSPACQGGGKRTVGRAH